MIVAELPEGSNVISITQKRFSFWTKTAEIETADSNGETAKYFLKVSSWNFITLYCANAWF